jgi:hypothetical protein
MTRIAIPKGKKRARERRHLKRTRIRQEENNVEKNRGE